MTLKHIASTLAAAVALSVLVSPASAATITSLNDTFDAEGTTINYASFANWNVTVGTVDTTTAPQHNITCVNNTGVCVDMDGSTVHAGTLVTKDEFAAGSYVLKFWISGNQRVLFSDSMTVSLGGYSETFTKLRDDPFVQIVRTVTLASNASLSFQHHGGIDVFGTSVSGDNNGIILDNVSVEATAAVPLPPALALFATGLATLGLVVRRRKKQAP